MKNRKTEAWKPVVGYEGIYEVSDRGRVRSKERLVKHSGGGLRRVRERFLKPHHAGRRLHVILSSQGRVKLAKIHRLVLEAFAGPCPDGMEGRHFPDRDVSNNNLSNLSWSDHATNCGDKRFHGTHQSGELNPRAKLTLKKVARIRADYAKGRSTQTAIAAAYGVTPCAIGAIVRNQSWKSDDHARTNPHRKPSPKERK